MTRSLPALFVSTALAFSVGCAATTDDPPSPIAAESAATGKAGWRALKTSAQVKATLGACQASAKRADDAFYCPTVERFQFSGAITAEVLTRFADKRNAELYAENAKLPDAVSSLQSRARGQISSVSDASLRTELTGHMSAIQSLLENAPGTRIVLASGYWAPSVNSDSIYVIDDNDHTVLVFEHGDTDG